MTFIKYQHLERFGNTEVVNIELGEIFVFPKIDGTNGSLWSSDYQLNAGSRNRHLSLDNDNAGFFNWAVKQSNILDFFCDNQDLRLYGEWLVPHSLKTYRNDAWRKFYVFDVAKVVDGELQYLHYNEYEPLLKEHSIDYIPPMARIKNANYDKLVEFLNTNTFLIEDGKGAGEGIVIKNYDFKNKYGRTTWAKIVTSEFKEKHTKEMGASYVDMKNPVEIDIVNKFLSKAMVDKVYDKIVVEHDGFSSKLIPKLLHTTYYDLVREESWGFIKEFKNPTINYSMLQHVAYNRVKELKSELF